MRKRMSSARDESKALIEKVKLKRSILSVYNQLKETPYSFFLDSALAPGKLGKFSFLGIEPFLIFKSKKDKITLDWINKKEKLRGNPFLILKKLLQEFKISPETRSHIPFTGGAVGYLSYDLKDFNERLPDNATDDLKIPDAIICFYDTILAYDHFRQECLELGTVVLT